MGNKNFFFKKITSLTGFVKNNKLMSYMLLTLLLSLAGLPPFFGFFAKFYFLNLFMLNNLIYLILLFSFVNLITIFYYLRVVKLLFQSKGYQPKLIIIKSFILVIFFVFIFIINILGIFYFEILFNFITLFFLDFE
jgi:NADH-quinone oxidoreductase subunit N